MAAKKLYFHKRPQTVCMIAQAASIGIWKMTKIFIFYDILYKINEKIWIKKAELNICNMI